MTEELRQNLDNVNKQKNQTEAILLHIKDGIISVDLNGNVTYINPAAINFFDLTQDDNTFDKIFKKIGIDVNLEKIVYLDDLTSSEQKVFINEKYINDSLFYNDRNFASTNTGTGAGNSMTYYTWDDSDFLNKSRRVSLNFTNNNDIFFKANGNLKYSIALIEENEALLAGGYSNENNKYYLYSGIRTWTMSPGYFGGKGSSASLKIISDSGSASSGNHTFYQNGVNPVINLKPNSLKSGDGTISNAYRVS